jgi:hypothetical protein
LEAVVVLVERELLRASAIQAAEQLNSTLMVFSGTPMVWTGKADFSITLLKPSLIIGGCPA